MLDRIVHAANHDVPVGQEDIVVVKRRETAADRCRMARGLLNRLIADCGCVKAAGARATRVATEPTEAALISQITG